MIEIKNVSKGFKNKKVLDNLSLTLPDYGFVVLKGPSGIGKTTLLNLITGLSKPNKGSILYNDLDITKMSKSEVDIFLQEHVSIIFQNFNLFKDKTVLENLFDDSKKLKYVNLENFENRMVNTLSRGEQQRISIARAISKPFDIMLADEPTDALDYENSKEILDILKEISKTKLVIMITHKEDEILEYADFVYDFKLNSYYPIERDKIDNKKSLDIVNNKSVNKEFKLRYKFSLIPNAIFLFMFLILSIFSVLAFENYRKGYYDFLDTNTFYDITTKDQMKEDEEIEEELKLLDISKFNLSCEVYEFYYASEFVGDNNIFVTRVIKNESLKDGEIVLSKAFYEYGDLTGIEFMYEDYNTLIRSDYNYSNTNENFVMISKSKYDEIVYEDEIESYYCVCNINYNDFKKIDNLGYALYSTYLSEYTSKLDQRVIWASIITVLLIMFCLINYELINKQISLYKHDLIILKSLGMRDNAVKHFIKFNLINTIIKFIMYIIIDILVIIVMNQLLELYKDVGYSYISLILSPALLILDLICYIINFILIDNSNIFNEIKK